MIDLQVVTKADIEQALNGDYHQLLRSCPATGPDLVYQGERYPADAVLGVSYLINRGVAVSPNAYNQLGEEARNSETNRTLLQNLGFEIGDHLQEDGFPGADVYQNFFDMLKFWIEQTNNNIANDHRVPIQEVQDSNLQRAQKAYTNPQFHAEYLDYKKFKIKIHFFQSGQYKGARSTILSTNLMKGIQAGGSTFAMILIIKRLLPAIGLTLKKIRIHLNSRPTWRSSASQRA